MAVANKKHNTKNKKHKLEKKREGNDNGLASG
jgi:hypothetical protein